MANINYEEALHDRIAQCRICALKLKQEAEAALLYVSPLEEKRNDTTEESVYRKYYTLLRTTAADLIRNSNTTTSTPEHIEKAIQHCKEALDQLSPETPALNIQNYQARDIVNRVQDAFDALAKSIKSFFGLNHQTRKDDIKTGLQKTRDSLQNITQGYKDLLSQKRLEEVSRITITPGNDFSPESRAAFEVVRDKGSQSDFDRLTATERAALTERAVQANQERNEQDLLIQQIISKALSVKPEELHKLNSTLSYFTNTQLQDLANNIDLYPEEGRAAIIQETLSNILKEEPQYFNMEMSDLFDKHLPEDTKGLLLQTTPRPGGN